MVFWGLVLARGSSKSVVNKNIKTLGNKPLIGWVLEPMKSSKIFDEIWVSTDDPRIESIALSYGVKVHRRSAESASDSATSLSSIQEFLQTNRGSDMICLIQCSSPFLQSSFLERAHNMMTELKYESVFSVYRSHSLRWSLDLKPLNFDPKRRPRRQEWTGELIESGHFYCFTTQLVEECGLIQGGKCGVVEIPKQLCLEIDDNTDWLLAERYLNFMANI